MARGAVSAMQWLTLPYLCFRSVTGALIDGQRLKRRVLLGREIILRRIILVRIILPRCAYCADSSKDSPAW